MTVSTELAKLSGQRLEYILLIEGIGWYTDENAGPASGFDGHVFVSSDLDGTIATIMDCTMHRVLGEMPSSIEDRLDPVSAKYTVGGCDFSLIDSSDDYLKTVFLPHLTSTNDSIDTVLAFVDTTVSTTSGSYATGDIVWLGGRECIKLGTKSGSDYTGSTRGYLGTTRGRADSNQLDGAGMTWAAGTILTSVNKLLYDRRVVLLAHVPGEVDTNIIRLYTGRIRDLSSDCGGVAWKLTTTGDPLQIASAREAKMSTLLRGYRIDPGIPAQQASGALTHTQRVIKVVPSISASNNITNIYSVAAAYQYRTEIGGTNGMVSGAWTTDPQALDTTNDTNIIDCLAVWGGKVVKCLKQSTKTGAWAHEILVDLLNPWQPSQAFAVSSQANEELEGRPFRFLLDNITDEYELSRFSVNRIVTRHPIDVALMFLTTMPNEFLLADAVTGSTSTVVQFADNTLPTADQFIGYALHCVEGDNKGESRVITDNSAGVGNTVTVERAFTNTPANGDQYQIRNTVYDVLPMPWGLSVHNSRIDIDSFEAIRDEKLVGAKLGKFAIGTSEKTDLIDLITENICSPYGFFIYPDRTTGKVTAKFIGDAMGTGIIETYSPITSSELLSVSDINHGLSKPVAAIEVSTRQAGTVNYIQQATPGRGSVTDWTRRTEPIEALSTDGAVVTLRMVSEEVTGAYPSSETDTVKISALLNSENDLEWVAGNAYSILSRRVAPPPTLSIKLDMIYALTVNPGDYLSVTYANIMDPYTGSIGMSNRTARVLETRLVPSKENHCLEVMVELLDNVSGARIAPACLVTGSGSDVNGEYVTVDLDAYVADKDGDRDHWYFVVGDKIKLRTADASGEDDLGAITGFGSNFVSDPTAATEASGATRIYYDGVLGSSLSGGEYVTFRSWTTANNTARMDLYSAYADTGGALDSDTGKEFG